MNKLIDTMDKANHLIGINYFSDLDNADTCQVCALGHLIRELPKEKRDRCVELIKEKELNSKTIVQSCMREVRDILIEEYKTTDHFLWCIQLRNDDFPGVTPEQRAKKVNTFVDSNYRNYHSNTVDMPNPKDEPAKKKS